MLSSIITPIVHLIHSEYNDLNENGALQPIVENLHKDKKKGAYLELFIKLIRNNTSTDMINNAVSIILKNNTNSEITDSVDGLLRQMTMTRSFRISTGKGEKKQTQLLMLSMYKYLPNLMNYIIPIASKEVGSWKDLVILNEYCIDTGTYPELVKSLSIAHCKAIKEGDYLASKWAPREQSLYKQVAKYYVRYMFGNSKTGSFKKYRLMISKNCSESNFLLETAMSNNNWDLVGNMLSQLTALNHTKYKNAFNRHLKTQYSEYLQQVVLGKTKINTTGLHIDSIVNNMLGGYAYYGTVFNKSLCENDVLLMNIQWKKFENDMVNVLLEDDDAFLTFANQISVIDRSGSMHEVSCAAVGIGLFVSKVLGIAGREKHGQDYIGFGDIVLRFSDNAEIIKLTPVDNFSDYLQEYITKENKYECGYSTNIMSVHKSVLELTKRANITQAPDLIILTDMQYDNVCDSTNYWERNRNFDVKTLNCNIDEYYKENNIMRGETRCWNLRGDTHTYEAEGSLDRVTMIGGFNQSMLKLFIEGKNVAEANGKDRSDANTWDTFIASQQHYNMVTHWLLEGINSIQDKNNLTEIEKQLVNNTPIDYVSDWIEL
jgi:hypothetical protein